MKKIIVIGCPGSGKSTLSRKLHKITNIPLFYLDMMYWNADRTIVDAPIFYQRISDIMNKNEWIMDGNYGSTLELQIKECDTVIFLDYPLEVCLDGIRERRGKARTDMPWFEAEDEEDAEFMEFVQNYHMQNRLQVMELFEKYSDKNIIVFNNREEARLFLEKMQIPSKIKLLIDNKPYTVDDVGMSGNRVLIFEDMVLKIEHDPIATRKQVQIMKWLEEKTFVPRVIEYEEKSSKCYLLMSKIGGKMSCDEYYLDNADILLKALADGLKMLWKVDISGCPVVRDLDTVLNEARLQVENNLVDVDNVDPETFGEKGFESPRHLLDWLENNRPTVEPVFSHGDYCLPNIFLEEGQVSGFIDLSRAGVGDKWNDIALCYRSLKHNFSGMYGGKIYEDFNADKLFEVLGIEPAWDKIKYYLLLDELF